MSYIPPTLPLPYELETREIMRQLARSSRYLAELKGAAVKIPNKNILIEALTLMEAKDSSEVENIVTTHDELHMASLELDEHFLSASTKEVLDYKAAIMHGFQALSPHNIISNKLIIEIQRIIEKNEAGYRKLPGTTLKDQRGGVVYMPPQDHQEIDALMENLVAFINDEQLSDLDPLIKMAILHHQFESIHPFYDGNGRTGRILCIIFLVAQGLLDLPILYLSRYITQNKGEYYRLLQSIRDAAAGEQEEQTQQQWQHWVLFMLRGVEETAQTSLKLVEKIAQLMQEFKHTVREALGRQYSHELVNHLFSHPYTKIAHLEKALEISRQTATKRLDQLVALGVLEKQKRGRNNYYINSALYGLFLSYQTEANRAKIESIFSDSPQMSETECEASGIS